MRWGMWAGAEQAAQGTLFDLSRLQLNPQESALMDRLNSEPVHVEELIQATGLPPGKIHAAVISLQLKGLVKQLPGNMIVKRKV